MADSSSPAKPSRITESGRSSAAQGYGCGLFRAVLALIVFRKALNGCLALGQLAVAALLKEATASSVLSNTSNTVASFVMCNTSFA